MNSVIYATGALVWTGIVCFAVLLLACSARNLLGYVRGAFRLQQLGHYPRSASRREMLWRGVGNALFALRNGGGWYVEVGGERVFYNAHVQPRQQ